jgi:hypothetical protein
MKIFPKSGHASGEQGENAADRPDQRGFSRAVGSDQGDDLTWLDLK